MHTYKWLFNGISEASLGVYGWVKPKNYSAIKLPSFACPWELLLMYLVSCNSRSAG